MKEKKVEATVKPEDKEFLTEAGDRWKIAEEAESEIRKLALEDLKFRAGEQWDSEIETQRTADRRPCLTINRLPQFTRQITNDQRQNRPGIDVTPVDSGADVGTAEVLLGLIRNIEQNSNADAAYDTAFQCAVNHGFGYWRVVTEYSNPMSFEQEIKIKRIRNPFKVYLDPSYSEADASDANWGFIAEDVLKDAYKAQYPDSKLAGMEDWSSIGDSVPDWVTKDGCRVVEYYYKKFKKVKIAQLEDGSVVEADKVPTGAAVRQARETLKETIHWCKMNGIEKLDSTEWLGRWIPIIPVLGDELDINGKRILEGIIRHAKDPQRMYNYWASAETETIALAPKAPYIGAKGQFEGEEANWGAANVKNFAYLQYNPKAIRGETLPAPQRNQYEPPVAAITQARAQAADDLKATTGIYDSALGARSNERSGKAILARNSQSETSNYHFIDNLGRALKHTGRIILDLVPKIYDEKRVMRIIGADGAARMVTVNNDQQSAEAKGVENLFNLAAGTYDIVMTSGPGYATKRQQAVDSMLNLTQSNPQIAEVAGDLIVENMDWPGARKVAARLKKALPPGLAEPEPGEPQQLPPQVQQKMQQMQQMVEQLTQALNEAKGELETKKSEHASKEKIAEAELKYKYAELKLKYAELRAKTVLETAKIESKEAQTALMAEVDTEIANLDREAAAETKLAP